MCNWSKVGTRELGEQSLTTKAGGQEDSPRDKSLSTMSGDGRRSLNGLGKALLGRGQGGHEPAHSHSSASISHHKES